MLYHDNEESGIAFGVHKDFACHYCPVFKASFNSSFIEGKTQKYTLTDTTEAVIRALVYWIYTQDIDARAPDEGSFSEKEAEAYEDNCLVQLWVLADRLLIGRLQNEVLRCIDERREKSKQIAIHTLNYIYENTPSGSPLRRFVVHYCTFLSSSKQLEDKSAHFPHEMPIEMLCYISATVQRFGRLVSGNFKLSKLFVEEG